MGLVGEVNQSNRLFLSVGDLHNFVHFDELSVSLIITFKLVDNFLQSRTHLDLQAGVMGVFVCSGSSEDLGRLFCGFHTAIIN